MSLFEKLKVISEVTDELTKDKPTVTITENFSVVCENYESVRLFQEDCIIIEFKDYDVNISGSGLAISFFTPGRLSLSGEIKYMEYIEAGVEEVGDHSLEK